MLRLTTWLFVISLFFAAPFFAACSGEKTEEMEQVVDNQNDDSSGGDTDENPDDDNPDDSPKDNPDDNPPEESSLPLALEVNFDDGSYVPLTYTTGRTDSPADADPAYSADAENGKLIYRIPNSPLRPKLSGFLDLPTDSMPITGELIHEFTFTNVSQLRALGAEEGSLAIAGCYIRGNFSQAGGKDWENGDTFGGFWFGFVKNQDGSLQSVIRAGNTNFVSEEFTAESTVAYQIHKTGTALRLLRKYDGENEWISVGEITLNVRNGGSDAVYITHVRTLNNSDEASEVEADDFKWYFVE